MFCKYIDFMLRKYFRVKGNKKNIPIQNYKQFYFSK